MQVQQSWDVVVGCFGCWWWAVSVVQVNSKASVACCLALYYKSYRTEVISSIRRVYWPCNLANGSYRQQCADDMYVARSVAMLLTMHPSSSHLMAKRCVETAVAARASETRHELTSVY
jgi:hypothetical protein